MLCIVMGTGQKGTWIFADSASARLAPITRRTLLKSRVLGKTTCRRMNWGSVASEPVMSHPALDTNSASISQPLLQCNASADTLSGIEGLQNLRPKVHPPYSGGEQCPRPEAYETESAEIA